MTHKKLSDKELAQKFLKIAMRPPSKKELVQIFVAQALKLSRREQVLIFRQACARTSSDSELAQASQRQIDKETPPELRIENTRFAKKYLQLSR